MNQIEQARALGQSIWLDNISRGMIASGELKSLIEKGVSGLTSNPTIFEKAIAGSRDYDQVLANPAVACKGAKEIYENLILEDIRSAADLLRPVYDRTGGEDGYASLEPDPDLAHDKAATVSEARRLFALLNRPNVMIKVPGTPEGIPAVRQLISEGININITLIFSLDAYRQVREAYLSGLEELARRGGDISKVASVASFFVSRVDTSVDALLEEEFRHGRTEMGQLLGKAAVANCKLAYQSFRTTFSSRRFARLRAKGARVQRVLWASTSTKNPKYPDLLYVESLVGRDTINTLPTKTLSDLLDHGKIRPALEEDPASAEKTMQDLDSAGINMEDVTDKLLDEGVKAFSNSLGKLLESIEVKRAEFLARGVAGASSTLGDTDAAVTATLTDLGLRDVVRRIWRKDHTVWKKDPAEISNRLGWLTVMGQMEDQETRIKDFVQEIRDAGFSHVVLLGMGGSSLGPEVARQTFGSTPGYPELIVLDSTVPARVRSVLKQLILPHTLFIVSSKSGGTVEPVSCYKYFRSKVEKVVGKDRAGRQFVAITDPDTALASLARADGFRHIFENPSDIGGRYSVLSYFGLVPMALAGIDVGRLLGRSQTMCQACASCVQLHDNPGAWLGAVLGTMALKKKDKLTLVTSPSVSGFALWVEQLVAESLGKQGQGMVPVAGEPLVKPEFYGTDRVFVYIRLQGDENSEYDKAIERLRSAGHPVVQYDLRDSYDLGAEFFRWEFATAVTGSILGVHPFDQPDVQRSKDMTGTLLQEYRKAGSFPRVESASSLSALLENSSPGSYFAIMAYFCQTPAVDEAFQSLRRRVLERYRIATTLGYGPRFLHSTGQLHKGGPNTGRFLQVTAARRSDVAIPGEPHSFGTLVDAQALGDLHALQQTGRKAARVQLESASAAAIRELAAEIK